LNTSTIYGEYYASRNTYANSSGWSASSATLYVTNLSSIPVNASIPGCIQKTTYAGYELPVRTLYDAIGWILSITAVPASNTVNQNNFCLPLIGLFGKWCSVLLPVESLPAMLHVAYWYDQGRFRLLLGATPGADQIMYSQDWEVWQKPPLESWKGELPPRSTISANRWSANKKDDVYWGVRGWDIIARRQDIFEENGMLIDESHNHRSTGPGRTKPIVGSVDVPRLSYICGCSSGSM
jgi:hypothetical protein